MTSAVISKSETQALRPLRELVPLIKEALRRSAAEIGDLLAEARPQFDTWAEFLSWTHRNFGFKGTQSREYLSLGRARENKGVRTSKIETLQDHLRNRGRDLSSQQGRVAREWTAPVDDIAERARREAERLRDEHLTREKERQAEYQLALRLIDIGYKVLAKELHPDKGGSKDAMARLSRVRDRLKSHA